MLSRYDGKRVRVTDIDGEVFTGVADVCPSGYGLVEFDRAEESILIDDVQIFLSDIEKIEELPDGEAEPQAAEEIPPEQFDTLIAELLDGPCWIADILPEQVPLLAEGQYFAVDKYFRQPQRLAALYRKYAEILLKLNCYCDMAVSFDSCEHWEKNPEPGHFANRLEHLSGNDFLRAVFPAQGAMIDLDPGDTYLTLYDPQCELLEKLQKLAASEGLFVWKGEN